MCCVGVQDAVYTLVDDLLKLPEGKLVRVRRLRLSLSLSLSLTHSLTHSPPLSLSHTHTLSLSLSHSLTHSLSLPAIQPTPASFLDLSMGDRQLHGYRSDLYAYDPASFQRTDSRVAEVEPYTSF
jgi:hypothetical protein